VSKIYEFTISDELGMAAHHIFRLAFKSCREQEEFELNCGGEKWPPFEVRIVKEEPLGKGFKYHCEAHKT